MTRTYLDSGVLIAGFRGVGSVGASSLRVMADLDREFVSSVFVRLEVLPKAIWSGRQEEVEFYESFFARVAVWAEPIDEVVANAERVAARYGLDAFDALHVGAAALLDADELVTTEGRRKPIHRATEVAVIAI